MTIQTPEVKTLEITDADLAAVHAKHPFAQARIRDAVLAARPGLPAVRSLREMTQAQRRIFMLEMGEPVAGLEPETAAANVVADLEPGQMSEPAANGEDWSAAPPPPVSALHAAAREYAKQGRRIFPCIPGEKRPAVEGGFHAASADLEKVDLWWNQYPDANIAFEPASEGLAVIDVEAEYIPEIAKLELPATFAVSTPRGGLHLYYKGSIPSTVRPLGPEIAVDTRGSGGYVLLVPSAVKGSAYAVENAREPVALPQAFIERMAKGKTEGRAAAPGTELDTTSSLAQARLYLEAQRELGQIAIEGCGGDNRTYKTLARLRDLGLSPAASVAMLEESGWNAACLPPWSHEELETRAAHVANYAQNDAGSDAPRPWPAETIARIAAQAEAKLPDDTGPVSFTELFDATVKPVEEVIAGLVEKRVLTLLSGPGGVNKSRHGLQWGLCLSAGANIFGRSVERSTFVHLSYEDHRDEVTRRAQAIKRHYNLPRETAGQYWNLKGKGKFGVLLAVSSEGELGETPFFAQVRRYLLETAGHKFIVVDSCYNAVQFFGTSKNDEEAVKAVINRLDDLCAETDSTILMLWHPSRAGIGRGDASGWAVSWDNAPRARLSLTADKDAADVFTLAVEKRNNGPKGKPLTLHWIAGTLEPRSTLAASQQANALADACVSVALTFAEHGDPIQKQRRFTDTQLEMIEHKAGYRPTQKEAKAELVKAMLARQLRYVKNVGKMTAGYYPFDFDPARARMTERLN